MGYTVILIEQQQPQIGERAQLRLDGGVRPGLSVGAMSPQESDRDPSWAWEERRWRAGVEKIRAGRPLRPAPWKGGARACVPPPSILTTRRLPCATARGNKVMLVSMGSPTQDVRKMTPRWAARMPVPVG